ncbi:MAG: hypothetical protein A3G81_14315 [Betaproteobacteria bacterium RIFCSPLOWO2_12_FULL_65_14]|nr:MAG: hypothetical protein A3G81_14315 [Betaproteobacteria bacterium RIFCSPLOWO2_12_FULL_65_14]
MLASPGVLLQGVLGIVLLAIVAGATISVGAPLWGASAWTWLLLLGYGASVWIIARTHSGHAWTAAKRSRDEPVEAQRTLALRPLVVKTLIAAAAVLAAGFVLANTAQAIAAQTGLGISFVGAVVLATSTSLPEVSTVLAAVRLKRYDSLAVLGTYAAGVAVLYALR